MYLYTTLNKLTVNYADFTIIVVYWLLHNQRTLFGERLLEFEEFIANES